MSQIAIDYRTQYEAAEKRIRELEEQLKDAGWEDHQRIAKAREILEANRKGYWVDEDIESALEALEGAGGVE